MRALERRATSVGQTAISAPESNGRIFIRDLAAMGLQSVFALPDGSLPSTRICCGVISGFTAGATMVPVPW